MEMESKKGWQGQEEDAVQQSRKEAAGFGRAWAQPLLAAGQSHAQSCAAAGAGWREAEHEVRWEMHIRDRMRMPWRKSDQVGGKEARECSRGWASRCGEPDTCASPCLLSPSAPPSPVLSPDREPREPQVLH